MESTKKLNAKLISLFAVIILLLGMIPMMALTAKPADAAGDSVQYTAQWSGLNKITLKITPTQNGTAYYQCLESSQSEPSVEDLKSNGTQVQCTANSTATKSITTGNINAKNIFLVYVDENGRLILRRSCL